MNDLGEQFDVSRETLEKLEAYADLLRRWNRKINLVSPTTIDDLWSRHFVDSVQLFHLVEWKGHWVDLGSGGGFPGLVVAILGDQGGDRKMTLVEADLRKATFLRTVIRELELSVVVVSERIEQAAPLSADVLSARALAPLVSLLGFAERHLAKTGKAVFPKGERAMEEVSLALEHWHFTCETHSSITDAKSTILCIGDIARV